jgi:hypothetical protein
MRIAVVMAAVALAGCASDKLASAPPKEVDVSGHWKLNAADSDDPVRLMQTQLANATAGAGPGGQTGPSGRGGRQNRGGGLGPGGPTGPAMPPVTALDEALRWPGKDLTLKQSSGIVTFVSDGTSTVCRLAATGEKHHHRPSGTDDASPSRDAPAHGRGDVPPPLCGWDEGTLVVKSGDNDDEQPPFEQRFSLADDGQRLVEVVVFRGGRSSGFTASREWDRSQP